jgi:hypothetical protein
MVYRSLLDRQHMAYSQMAISVLGWDARLVGNGAAEYSHWMEEGRISNRRSEMSLFEADYMNRPKARPASETPTVLLEGSVPQQFRFPAEAIVSDCTAVTAVASSLDSHGVDYLRDLLSGPQPPDVRLILIVHAKCPTKEKDLFDLLTLLDTNRLKVWILAVKAWGQRCTWVLCVRRDSPAHVLWTSTAGDFGLLPRLPMRRTS